MKYTKDEYIKLGRTLQKRVTDTLSDNVIKFTTVALTFKNGKYRTFYEVKKCYDSNPFDMDTLVNELHAFNLYQQMIDYLNSIGFEIDELVPAKGLKITF